VLSATTATTDADGNASVTATANATAGSYAVVASVEGVATTASFALTNTPGLPGALHITSGDGQSAVVAQAFAAPLAVRVTDADANPVPGVPVEFFAPASGPGATLSSQTVLTDADGAASVTATANTIAGEYHVAAVATTLQTNFSLTNLAGSAAALTATGGTPQSAIVGQPFAAPLAVHVTDAFGNAAVGTDVTFTPPASGASAVLSSTVATVDANGNASVTATANAIEGTYTVTAGIAGGATAAFDLTNTFDPSDVIFRDGFDP
jgi:hypothetical protein